MICSFVLPLNLCLRIQLLYCSCGTVKRYNGPLSCPQTTLCSTKSIFVDKIRSARKVNPRRSGLQQLPIRIIQNSYYSVLLYRFFIPSWRTHTSITSLFLFLTNALTNRICIRHISLVMFSSSNQASKYQANEVTSPCH